jgi:hypothetical protein
MQNETCMARLETTRDVIFRVDLGIAYANMYAVLDSYNNAVKLGHLFILNHANNRLKRRMLNV